MYFSRLFQGFPQVFLPCRHGFLPHLPGRKSFDTIDELSEEDIKEAQDAIEEALTPLVGPWKKPSYRATLLRQNWGRKTCEYNSL